jgi:hypothetical protein
MANDLSPLVETPRFVFETDEVPAFWQFLHGLRGDDLLVELIVNELDARSPLTEIRFEPDRLICVGEGQQIDQEGWDRLRKIRGAGDLVAAKNGLFGIKNHGLKACFTLGNDIFVRSDQKRIHQTLFARGADRPAYPGVFAPPVEDQTAPPRGAAIEVPYRRKAFQAPVGERRKHREPIVGRFAESLPPFLSQSQQVRRVAYEITDLALGALRIHWSRLVDTLC